MAHAAPISNVRKVKEPASIVQIEGKDVNLETYTIYWYSNTKQLREGGSSSQILVRRVTRGLGLAIRVSLTTIRDRDGIR